MENSDFYATDDENDFEVTNANYDSDSSSDVSRNEETSVVETNLNPNDELNSSSSSEEEDSIPLSRLFPNVIRPVQEGNDSDVSSSFFNNSTLGTKKRKQKKTPATNQSDKRRKTRKTPAQKWHDIDENCDLETDFPQFLPLPIDVQNRQNYYPIDYFHQYFDETFFKGLTENTYIHFQQSCNKLLNVTETAMRAYVGITLLVSVLRYPRIRMYWSKSFKIPLIANVMSRNRYFKIRNFLHVVNNLAVLNEEKVRPIINSFHNVVLRLPREENVSIDKHN